MINNKIGISITLAIYLACFLSGCANQNYYCQANQNDVPLKYIAKGQCDEFKVNALYKWNHSGYFLQSGIYHLSIDQKYKCTSNEDVPWRDWFIDATPEDGWCGAFGGAVGNFVRFWSRNPNAKMYSLVCSIGMNETLSKAIGRGLDLSVTNGGELLCFANDIDFAYSNNVGCVMVEVCRAFDQ